jgi:hypothetical protein
MRLGSLGGHRECTQFTAPGDCFRFISRCQSLRVLSGMQQKMTREGDKETEVSVTLSYLAVQYNSLHGATLYVQTLCEVASASSNAAIEKYR